MFFASHHIVSRASRFARERENHRKSCRLSTPRWQAETPRELRRSFALSGLCDRSTVLPRPLGLLEATFVAPIRLESVARSRGGDGSVLDRLRRRCRRMRPSPGPWPGSASQRHCPVMTEHPRACRVGPSAVPARWRTGEASSPRSLDQRSANALVSRWLMRNRQGTSPLETSSTESRSDFSRGLHCFREGPMCETTRPKLQSCGSCHPFAV